MSRSKVPNIKNLFKTAFEDGAISASSFQSLNINDITNQIENGMGISVNEIQSSEVVLVTMMIDDSSSIHFAGNTTIVIEGHNEVLNALLDSDQNHRILAHTCYLNGKVLFPYIPLILPDKSPGNHANQIVFVQNPEIQLMNKNNYTPNLGTPLYDKTFILLGRVMAKYQEFAEAGVHAKTVTLIITDGADEHSEFAAPGKVRSLVMDMLGENHVIAAMGIDDNGKTDFRQVFHNMGIRDEWILTPGNNASEIRNAFRLFSQSAIQVSRPNMNLNQIMTSGLGFTQN